MCEHYDCPYRTEFGYCKFTACINTKYNGSGTFLIVDNEDTKIKDLVYGKDYGIVIYS